MAPPKKQAKSGTGDWFWNKEHQAKEREAAEDLKNGRYKDFSSADSLIRDLKRTSPRKKA